MSLELNHDEIALAAELVAQNVAVRKSTSGSILVLDFANPAVASTVFQKHEQQIGKLRKLRELTLKGQTLSEDSISILTNCENLQLLDLEKTSVDDSIFEKLHHWPKLKILGLTGTRATRDRVRDERKRLIQLRILYVE